MQRELLNLDSIVGTLLSWLPTSVTVLLVVLALFATKRLLERNRLRTEKVSQDYLQSFNQITRQLMDPLSHAAWVELYLKLVRYDLELDADEGVRQVLVQHTGRVGQRERPRRRVGRWIDADQILRGRPARLSLGG